LFHTNGGLLVIVKRFKKNVSTIIVFGIIYEGKFLPAMVIILPAIKELITKGTGVIKIKKVGRKVKNG
jgi:hypothetical protein